MKNFPTVFVDPESGLAVLLEVNGQNLQSSNKKLRLAYGDAQLTVLPLEALESGSKVFSGKGAVGRAQLSACADTCAFRSKSIGGALGGCYVNYLGDKAAKAMRGAASGESVSLRRGALVRATVWGDVSRLSQVGQDYVKSIIDHTGNHLMYISDIASTPMFYGQALASCQSAAQVLQAILSGWRVYAGTVEAWQALKDLGASPVYKCPVKGDGRDRFGCAQCPIKCNGQRHVVAYTVHTNV